MEEINELIDELVSRAGPTAGCIKKNQDPVKVARLLELGYNEPVKKAETDKEDDIKIRLKRIEEMLADHEKRLKECSIRR